MNLLASKCLADAPLPYRVLSRPVVIVVAHPDDEVLGVGTLLSRFRNLRAIVHVTDGAPRRGSDAANAGAASWQDYAALRRREFEAAMRTAGVTHAHPICLGYPDQEAFLHIDALGKRLVKIFQRFRPATVFTHPYEGGHPDHDACAVAVRLACSVLSRRAPTPEVLEFTSYHVGRHGGFEAERFLDRHGMSWPRSLTDTQRHAKQRTLANYMSQQPVLSQFPLQTEPIRIAPAYDFRKPPHRGKLYYENFDWGISGAVWRRKARQAMARLAAR